MSVWLPIKAPQTHSAAASCRAARAARNRSLVNRDGIHRESPAVHQLLSATIGTVVPQPGATQHFPNVTAIVGARCGLTAIPMQYLCNPRAKKILYLIQLDKGVRRRQGKKVSILPTVGRWLGRYFDMQIMVNELSRIRLKFIGSATYGDKLAVRSGPIVNFPDVFLFDKA